jgi:type IV pilus biogenesis protein CpaD/CtpE
MDNVVNPYNLNHPTFGCTVSSNMAQMVTDKNQFINPSIQDSPDARKGVQATDNYNITTKPETDFKALSTSESIASSTGTGR